MQHQGSSLAQEHLSGTIEKFLFQNSETFFAVFVLTVRHHGAILATGTIPALSVGQEVNVVGTWTMHQKFGKQFQVTECTQHAPTSIIGLKKYLGSGLIKGVGKAYAEKLVDFFGVDVLRVIDEEPQRLAHVSGIGVKRIEKIVTAWQDQKEISKIMIFLQEKDVSPAYAAKIYKKYRQNTLAVLQENPYRIADEIWGIGFKMADQIAQKVGIALHAPQRIAAGIAYQLSQGTSQGHLYSELQDLKDKASALLELGGLSLGPALIKNALHLLYNEEKIKLITEDGVHYIALAKHYYVEMGVARKLQTLLESSSSITCDVDAIYTQLRVSKEGEIALNDDQQNGIITALSNKVAIITGGPGTGKTTLIKKLLHILEQEKILYLLAAPTGRAAKRMMESTGRHAVTLHRLLEFDPHGMGFLRNEQNALKTQFLILDEASMIDIFLAHSVLRALPQNAHLILLGDTDQLPSVGAGNFLYDCLGSKIISHVRLTQIFRQAQDSLIVVNAHRINQGEFPLQSLPEARHDFVFIKEDAPENISPHLTRIFMHELKKHKIASCDAMVLAPMNRGIVGTHSLNVLLQKLLNPGERDTVMTMGTAFKVGDKVMQIRNNYDKIVFNGDIGRLLSIDYADKELIVSFDEREVMYEFDELHELVLAYAITIHKSQGSEYGAVIVPLFMQHFTLLQRNLVYTALTRAKKLCIFIGQPRALAMAIKNVKCVKRITFLQKFLTCKEYV